jgi:hypothetical protein
VDRRDIGRFGLENRKNTVRDPWRPRKIRPAEAKPGTDADSVNAAGPS